MFVNAVTGNLKK